MEHNDIEKNVSESLLEETENTGELNNDVRKREGRSFFNGVKKIAKRVSNDVQERATAVATWVRDETEVVVGKVSEEIDKRDDEKYGPIYIDDNITNYRMPAMLYITEKERVMNIPKYKDAIAFDLSLKGGKVLTIKPDRAGLFPCKYSPSLQEGIYYVHPVNQNRYIDLDDYFTTLNTERVAELRHIAQSLGATHFSVIIKEEKTTISKIEKGGGVKGGVGKQHADVKAEHNASIKEYSYIGIADESDFLGKEPVMPELCLWASDQQIRSLIQSRMDKDSPLLKTKYTLNYNTSSGIKVKDAGKVAGLLKQLKFEGSANIVSQAEKESKRVLEYEIEFKPY
ncbi:MAG: hypothetical protein IJ091_00820 [Oscillospiraceae bacterium]|nr:hypothetical protein [Oscillospiraceae bacterium]